LDADIDTPLAWDLWQGDADFRIAILDSGVRYDHTDLTTNIWVNPGEDDGDGVVEGAYQCDNSPPNPNGDFNCVDDDGNGFVDDLIGWNFLYPSQEYPVNAAEPTDDAGHGTHVAGIVAARGDNGVGVAGVNWRAKIVALKICGPPTDGGVPCYSSAAIGAVQYCINNGIRVSSNSWGGTNYSQELYGKVQAAQAMTPVGHIFVAAAGNKAYDNEPLNNDNAPIYPASYGHDHTTDDDIQVVALDNVIAVAATNNDDGLWSDSHYGRYSVDVGAPGVNVFSTNWGVVGGNGYGYRTGTSMATPHVAGVVALVWSRFQDWTWQRVKNRILGTVRKVPSLEYIVSTSTPVATEGVVNAYRAIHWDCNGNDIDDLCDISCSNLGCSPPCGGSANADEKTIESDCCIARDIPGCSNSTIAECVCGSGPTTLSCCLELWDAQCAQIAATCSPLCKNAADSVPDACQCQNCPCPAGPSNCNDNGLLDSCDVTFGMQIDCNSNSVLDGCEGSGDYNFDCVVNLEDFAQIQICFSGPDNPYPCGIAGIYLDVDKDLDLDWDDWDQHFNYWGTEPAVCAAPSSITCADHAYTTLNMSTNGPSGLSVRVNPNPAFQNDLSIGAGANVFHYANSPTLTISVLNENMSAFTYWEIDGVPQAAGQETINVTMNQARSVRAVCGQGLTSAGGGSNKNRSLSFSMPTAVGTANAILVKLLDLQNPNPPNASQYPPPDFSTFEFATCTAAGETVPPDANGQGGCARWVGPPRVYLEDNGSPGGATFKAARLQCTPFYHDWSAEGLVHIFGSDIAPSSTYELELVAQAGAICSAPLTLQTARWGDIDGDGDVDGLDVTHQVNKFRNSSGAFSKAVTKVQPNFVDLNADVNAIDIVSAVDAFRGFAYPYSGPCPCPSAVICNEVPCSDPGPCSQKVCIKTCGGISNGVPCTRNSDCGGAHCVGGVNNGASCTTSAYCVGGSCVDDVVCGNTANPDGKSGYCRDKCGRCTP
jgi:hypothetical protein